MSEAKQSTPATDAAALAIIEQWRAEHPDRATDDRDLELVLDAVIALPPDTAWSRGTSDASWTIWTRTYRGMKLEIYNETPDGFSWMAWAADRGNDTHYEPADDGDAATLSLAQLQAERFAEGEHGGPATDALAAMEAS